MTDSPFRAGFGKSPPVLAGRGDLLTNFDHAIEPGQWGQERSILIRGFRGVGKTTMINALEDVARGRGWFVVSETATAGFYDRMFVTHLPAILNEIAPEGGVRVTSAALTGVGSITLEYRGGRVVQESFRTLATTIAKLLARRGAGLLFTLDEINADSGADLRRFAADFQHLVREDLEVAFVGAGLHTGINALLEDRSITFLRRSTPALLDILDYDDALEALERPIRTAGRTVDAETIDYLARATQGYPFLVQLIGDIAWKRTPDEPAISLDDAKHAFRKARRSMGAYILEPSLADLSDTDRTVLAAMALDDGPSSIPELRARLGGAKPGWMSMYRQRLLDAGVVYAAGRGRLDIAVPYLRDYLREHVVANAASEIARARAGFPAPPPLG